MTAKSPVAAAIGIDHRHSIILLDGLIAAGAKAKGWWGDAEPQTPGEFVKRFPDLPKASARRQLLEDPEIDVVVTAAIPADRARLAIEAMEHGKDVVSDRPGCTTLPGPRHNPPNGRADRAHLVGEFFRTLQDPLAGQGKGPDRRRCHRSGRADHRHGPATPQLISPRRVVLRTGAIGRHPRRTWNASDRPLPLFYRCGGCRNRCQRRRPLRRSLSSAV